MTDTYCGNDNVTLSWWYFIGCPRQKEEDWKSEEEYKRGVKER